MPEPQNQPSLVSRRNLLWLGGTAAVAAVAYKWVGRAPVYEGGSLTVTQAHDRARDRLITLVDIRRPDEWQLTGIGVGAHPIDMRRKDFDAALAQVAGPDRNTPIALICARGVRSARMSKRLTTAGYTNIIDVPEGMLGSRAGPGWLARNLPTRSFAETSG